jgi:radical SAM superfamily enzyme YgiQ (UPF0313 family)
MMPPRVVFLAVDTQWVDPSGSYASFSYAVRKLEASLRSAPDLQHVETHIIDLKSDDPEPFFEAIQALRPTVVAASVYVWSVKTFLEVARRVKQWDPSIRVIFGGPAARASLFNLAPYRPLVRFVDVIAVGEGEEVIRAFVRDPSGQATEAIPGLLIPHPLGFRATAPAERPVLDSYASPYQMGTAPLDHTGFMETFRGCPISCAFCQWGEQRSDRVYSAEYLASHLRGLVASKAQNVFFTDAAFNLSTRAFRNLMEAERQVKALAHFAIHGHLYPTHVNEMHLEFLDRVGKAQVSIGVQTFDPEVLRKLGRPFDLDRFERVLRELRGRIAIDVELIYGLPGDNPDSFRRTFEKVLELADSARVFFPMVLPDALLERVEEYKIRFDPETFLIEECEGWSRQELREGWEQLARSTEGLPNRIVCPTWFGFMTRSGLERSAKMGAPPEITAERAFPLAERLRTRARGWTLASARQEPNRLLLELGSPAGKVTLEISPPREDARCFVRHGRLAYSYRGSIDRAVAAVLGRVIEIIHPETERLMAGG